MVLYLIDSIVSNEKSGDEKNSYRSIFGSVIDKLFMTTYTNLPPIPELKNLFVELLDAWTMSGRFEKPVLDSLSSNFRAFRSREVAPLPPRMPFQPFPPPQAPRQNYPMSYNYDYNNVHIPITIISLSSLQYIYTSSLKQSFIC